MKIILMILFSFISINSSAADKLNCRVFIPAFCWNGDEYDEDCLGGIEIEIEQYLNCIEYERKNKKVVGDGSVEVPGCENGKINEDYSKIICENNKSYVLSVD